MSISYLLIKMLRNVLVLMRFGSLFKFIYWENKCTDMETTEGYFYLPSLIQVHDYNGQNITSFVRFSGVYVEESYVIVSFSQGQLTVYCKTLKMEKVKKNWSLISTEALRVDQSCHRTIILLFKKMRLFIRYIERKGFNDKNESQSLNTSVKQA